MRVKIENKWYDSEDIPICIELDDAEKSLIADMGESATKLAIFPPKYRKGEEHVRNWMNDKVKWRVGSEPGDTIIENTDTEL